MDEATDTGDLRAAAKEYLVRYGGDAFPNLFVSAKGSVVIDDTGREVLDFTSGQMCSTIGHNHPAIVEAVDRAGRTALHMFSGMIPEAVAELGKKLATWMPAPLKKSLFLNTGGESNEAALRMAKMYTGRHEVIALGGSWHGTGAGAASVTYASDRRGYGPTIPGVYVIPEPNAYRCPVEHCRDACDGTCQRVGLNMFDMASRGEGAAIIAEPIISAGGVLVPPDDYFVTLKQEAHKRGMLLILDEAQTAFGRIGYKTAAERFNTVPDIMALSKTLGGGVPLSATVTTDEIEADIHEKGYSFYTSHVADPLPAEVGLAVLATIEAEDLIQAAIDKGAHLRGRLEDLQQKHEAIGEVRGEGLLLGVELVKDRESRVPDHELGAASTARCFELGLSMNIRRRPERGAVWRIAPPLTVSTDEIDKGIDILDQALTESQDRLARQRA